MSDRAGEADDRKDAYAWMNEPGDQGQPGEFVDTPENEPGDQGGESLADGMKVAPKDLHRDPAELDDPAG